MRFITNCCGEVFKCKSLRTTYFSSHLEKWTHFATNFNFKTHDRKFSSQLKKSYQNLNQDFCNVLAKVESLHSSHFTRNLLYPETDDEIINQLKTCYDLEDVMQIINANESLSHQQLNQIVLVLRDLQKLQDVHHVLMDTEQKMGRLYDSPSFQKLLSLIALNIDKMDANEISYCLLYLHKLNVNCNEPVMMKLIDACEKSIFKTDRNLVLQNLSRFFITIKEENNIWSLYTMSSYLPFLIESLDTCENHDNFRHITVCFQKCVPLLNSDILNKYVAKLDLVLRHDDGNEDKTASTRTMLKAIVFLNFKHWNSLYINEVRQLMAAMKGKLHHLCFTEVSLLHKAMLSLQEPFDLSQEIEETTENWIKTYQNADTPVPVLVFQSLFPGIKLMTGEDVKNNLMEYVGKSSCDSDNVVNFSDLHLLIFGTDLKFDRNITTAYWSMLVNVLKSVQQKNSDKFLENLTWSMHRYIHLIGSQKTLRNDFFERSLVSNIIGILRDDKFTCGPAEYSKFFLTILAFSNRNPFHFFTEAVWQKLLEYLPRLSIYDNLFVSLILHIAYDRFKKRRYGLAQFLHYHVHLNAAANANTSYNLRHNSDSTPEKLNTFLYSYILTKGIKTSEIFNDLCDRFQQVRIDQLHSKTIRDSIFNFTVSEHLIPEFIDVMIEYCIREKHAMFGNTVANVLNYCFLFGYVCNNNMNEFLTITTSLIERDKKLIPKPVYLRSALALSYFRELPSSWTDYIFNIKFLEQLDGYFDKLNFKKTNSLRKELMELNRVVCIDYPYREVPWFHEKYCQELITLERQIPNDFLTSVLNVVKSIVKTDTAIDTNYITPYGHRIDVVLYLNKDGEPTNINDCDPTKLRKIALILRSYSPSIYYKGKGRLELFSRQLEMLNFEVILLSKQEWNSMYMSNSQEKTNYLRKLIWPTLNCRDVYQ